MSDESIFIANEDRGYEIWVYDVNGNLIRKVRKEYQKIQIQEDYKQEKTKNLPEQLKQITYFPENFPPLQGVLADEFGRLFVMTYEQDENSDEYIFDIFNSDGVFIGRTQLDALYQGGLVMAKFKNGHFYYISQKENGFKVLNASTFNWH